MEFKFEKNVPLPDDTRHNKRNPAWLMQPGDSVVVPKRQVSAWCVVLRRRKLRPVTRSIDNENVRLWCIERESQDDT